MKGQIVWVVHKNGHIYGIFTSKKAAIQAEKEASYGLGCEGSLDTRVGVTKTKVT